MRKKVWIMNHYAGKMAINNGGRHYWFADFLYRKGYEPVVFCSNSKHSSDGGSFYNFKELWQEHIAEEIGVPFVYIKAREYVGNGKQRVLNMIDFYFNLKKTAKEYAKKYGKPDVIYASSVHPLTLVAGIQLAKSFGVKCVCEVRDLWPEAIVAYSKNLIKSNPFVKLLYQGEKWIYKNADALIFTQEGGADYIREHKWDIENGGVINMKKVFHINNGVDLEAFKKNKEEYYYEDDDLDNSKHFKVIYTGAIRRINNLGIILDVAKELTETEIKFLIFGDGDEIGMLRNRVEQENITNVVFKGFVNKKYIPSIVSRADLNLVHWEMNPLLKVGESYNKSFEYFAAGKPVFYTVRPGYSIVEKYNCGMLPSGFTAKELAEDIRKMRIMDLEERNVLAQNSKTAAMDYDFKVLTDRLVEILESI